jgi:PKD domain-containing protein
MRTHSVVRSGWIGARGAVLLCAVLALHGCGLDNVDIPELDGPSTFAANLQLRANPDLLVADGASTALITATFYDVNGRPAANRQIFFTIADEDGRFAAIGSFPTAEGPGFAVTALTDAQGVARVVYQVPVRTDATADQIVLIAARPIGDDASAAVYRTVRIELRSAEPRLFPPTPGNLPPDCGITIETPNGVRTNVAILFQTRSFDRDGTIVRYEWFCGSGTGGPSYAPDIACVYRTAGSYSVTHRVTDDDGEQAECQVGFTIR